MEGAAIVSASQSELSALHGGWKTEGACDWLLPLLNTSQPANQEPVLRLKDAKKEEEEEEESEKLRRCDTTLRHDAATRRCDTTRELQE
ncbi:hypothetical protein NQZ68_019406 [Dissostichus eleginoides]|nr:hypothetical protein NQZ68_019406 [Dissostichus eleginoides]